MKAKSPWRMTAEEYDAYKKDEKERKEKEKAERIARAHAEEAQQTDEKLKNFYFVTFRGGRTYQFEKHGFEHLDDALDRFDWLKDKNRRRHIKLIDRHGKKILAREWSDKNCNCDECQQKKSRA